MYYILEYNYVVIGGDKGCIKRSLHDSKKSLNVAICNCHTSMRCSNLRVVEVEEVRSYKPVIIIETESEQCLK